MRLEIKDLQDAFVECCSFPMYLLRYSGRQTVRYWNEQSATDAGFETLAFVEEAPK